MKPRIKNSDARDQLRKPAMSDLEHANEHNSATGYGSSRREFLQTVWM